MAGYLTEIVPGLVVALVLLIQIRVVEAIVQYHFRILLARIDEIDERQQALLRPRIQVDP